LIGVGLGGFVDGIVLHQIMQWHNMLSNLYPPHTMENMRLNMVWDGVFHALVWVVTLVGICLLWSAASGGESVPPRRAFVGALILGWGLFNLIEGLINHQLLALHYVKQVSNYTVYNLTFLAVGGGLLVVVGWMLMKGGSRMAAGK
jgi:uncharacterized membrane protein